jgi:hypothetical protein
VQFSNTQSDSLFQNKNIDKVNGHYIRRALNKIRSIKFNQNLMSFGFFLLVAAIFWFFNALNKEYNTDLIVPVRYVNLPDNKILVGESENSIKVNISAFGYQIIDYKTSTISPVLIDFNKFLLSPVPNNKNRKFYILTSTFRDEISSSLGENLRINKISPDSLMMELVKVVSKKVPVKQNFEIDFRKQYMLNDSVKFFPDSVIIKGKESAIDTIQAVYTKKMVFKDFHDSLWFEIGIKGIRGTELNQNKVKCFIQAEQFTEMEFKLPVFILNEPVGYSVKLFPSEVRLIFNVGFKNYKKITIDQFRIVADYFEIEKSNKSRVLLNLNKKPANVSNIRIDPQSVDYIIEKND